MCGGRNWLQSKHFKCRLARRRRLAVSERLHKTSVTVAITGLITGVRARNSFQGGGSRLVSAGGTSFIGIEGYETR